MCYCVYYVISVQCVKVEGVGADGRMFVMARPSEAEQINTLWGLYLGAEKEKEELKARLDFKVSVILVYECIIDV